MESEWNGNEKMGRFISEMRKEKGLTQKELAEQLGVTDKAVSKWERAVSSPDIGLLIPLAKILGVSAGELLGGERAERSAENMEKDTEDMVEEALNYSHRTSFLKRRKMQGLLLAGVSGIFLTACMVCLICDYAISRKLSWSLVVAVSLFAAWILLFAPPRLCPISFGCPLFLPSHCTGGPVRWMHPETIPPVPPPG